MIDLDACFILAIDALTTGKERDATRCGAMRRNAMRRNAMRRM
jgi:hypothetical protein